MERPILFSGEMVRAILEGRKTQTRRVVKRQKLYTGLGYVQGAELEKNDSSPTGFAWTNGWVEKCPYEIGDTLWVKETWRPADDEKLGICIEYKADSQKIKPVDWSPNDGWKCEQEVEAEDYGSWHPSIFMSRWASRIDLIVKNRRVERVQDISEEDALAEGIVKYLYGEKYGAEYVSVGYWTERLALSCMSGTAVNAFARLWDSINAKRGHGWDKNDGVWVYEFERIK